MENNPSWMQNEKIKQYFDGLPASVQENIMKGSTPFSSFEEIEQCANEIKQKQNLE